MMRNEEDDDDDDKTFSLIECRIDFFFHPCLALHTNVAIPREGA